MEEEITTATILLWYLPQALCLITLFLPWLLARSAVVIAIPLSISLITLFLNVSLQRDAILYPIPILVFLMSLMLFIKACLDGDLI